MPLPDRVGGLLVKEMLSLERNFDRVARLVTAPLTEFAGDLVLPHNTVYKRRLTQVLI